jgi:uncharacterized membrane protein YeaQ/YmgE (transglycosylase-associated protein family)
MSITLDEVLAWLIVGALAGSLAGMLVTRRRSGFGYLLNLGVGLVGALIGGLLFKLLRIDLGLIGQVTISLREVVAGFIGSLIFLAAIWGVRMEWARRKSARDAPEKK